MSLNRCLIVCLGLVSILMMGCDPYIYCQVNKDCHDIMGGSYAYYCVDHGCLTVSQISNIYEGCIECHDDFAVCHSHNNDGTSSCDYDYRVYCSVDEDCRRFGSSCHDGQCVCDIGLEFCNGSCVDTSDRADHCGSCGNSCGENEACIKGECKSMICSDWEEFCSDVGCVPLNTNEHCGGCEISCIENQYCSDGRCLCINDDGCGESQVCTDGECWSY